MEKYILEKIISKVKEEKCSVHQHTSSFEIYDGAVIVKDYCCSDFLTHLKNRIQEEMDSNVTLF